MALALGARAVLVGRPAMYGLAFGGSKGVAAGARDPARGDGERARAARLPLAGRGDRRARQAGVAPMGVAELTRNAVHVLPAGALEAKLALGRPLRVKLGIDVTSPDIHVGRGIPLQRMRAFQDEGHVGVLIVGDYTTRIGDPSGRSTERPILSDEEIDRNAETYVEQALQILDPRADGGAAQQRVARAAELRRRHPADADDDRRADARARRLRRPLRGRPADLGVGAPVPADAGVRLRRRRGGRRARRHRPALQPARRARGDAGVRPRAAGRAHDAAPRLLGRREDELVGRQQHPARRRRRRSSSGARCASPTTCSRSGTGSSSSRSPSRGGDPLEAKLALARWIVARSHGEEAAREAEEHFTRVVREGRAPEDVPEHALAGRRPRAPARRARRRRSGSRRARRAG